MWMLLLWFGLEPQVIVKQSFQPPSGEEYLAAPYASCFGEDGRLYVLDPTQARILIWHGDGRFFKGFGRKGEGPGEWIEPIQIDVKGDRVYVWQRNGKMSRFTREGAFLNQFTLVGAWPRRFGVLDDGRVFINHRFINDQGRAFYVFEIGDDTGKRTEIKRDHNPGFLEVKPGNNNAEFLAYMADVDIQKDPDGGFWYGFGYENKLHHLSPQGVPDKHVSFDLPKGKPTAEERAFIEEAWADMPDGSRVRVKNLPGLKIHFDRDKAYFTQFLVKEDKVVFVLTANGGSDGVGDGDSRASYYIASLKTGEILQRGRYQFPLESQVHYRNGRIVAFIVDEDDSFKIQEISLKGL